MDARFVITQAEQLKAVSEPLLIRMVEALVQREQTIAEVAKRLAQPLSKLYHHVDVRLDAGLIRITRRVRRRGTEERWLRAFAKDNTVDDGLLSFRPGSEPGPDALIELTESLFRGTMDELSESARVGTIHPTKQGRRCLLETQRLQLTEAVEPGHGRARLA